MVFIMYFLLKKRIFCRKQIFPFLLGNFIHANRSFEKTLPFPAMCDTLKMENRLDMVDRLGGF